MRRLPTTWDQQRIDELRAAERYDDAIALLEPLYEEGASSGGPLDDETLLTGHWLALVYADAGRLDDAIRLGELVLVESRRFLGGEAEDTLTTESNLGIDCYNAGRLEDAYSHLFSAYASRERVLGPEHPDTLWTGDWLAFVCAALGRLDDAIDLGRKVLEGERRALGPEAERTLKTASNLGIDLRNAARVDESIALLEETHGAWVRAAGEDAPLALWTAGWLALAYADAGRLDAAVELARHVYDRRLGLLGEASSDTLESGTDLGSILVRSGRGAEAVDLLRGIHDHRSQQLGPDDARTLRTGHELARAYGAGGRHEEAIETGEQVLAGRRRTLGEDDPATLVTAYNLGSDLASAGRDAQAITLLEDTYERRKRVLGSEHVDTLLTGALLAYAYGNRGRLDDAIAVGREVVAGFESSPAHGAEDEQNLVRSNLGIHLVQAGRPEEAIPVLEEAYEDRSRMLGGEHSYTLLTGHWLARAYADAGRAGDATRVAEEVLARRTRTLGPDDAATLETSSLLAQVRGSEPAAPTESAGPGAEVATALGELEAMVGLQAVKQEVRSVVNSIQYMERRRAAGLPIQQVVHHMLFVGNPGTGKTTVARLLARIFGALRVLEQGQLVEASRSDLVETHQGETAKATQAVFESAIGGVLFVDEAYSLINGPGDNFGQEAVDTLVKLIEDHRDEICVIGAGYTDKMAEFIDANPGLKSRFPTTIHFADYDVAALCEIFAGFCAREGYTTSPEAEFQVRDVFSRYPRGRNFGNARVARDLFESAVRRLGDRMALVPDADAATLAQLAPEDIPGIELGTRAEAPRPLEELLAELDALVGLERVKSHVHDLVDVVTMATERRRQNLAGQLPTLHRVFSGNPGTGKTTVARLLSRIYASLGVFGGVGSGRLVEVSRANLVGQYQGHTAPQTTRMFESAIGGVLFIDEAYALSRGGADRDEFGQEAIDTLVKLMEDHHEEVCVIAAGYPTPMAEFVASNPGLESRFTETIEFDDYSDDELTVIFRRMCADGGYGISDDAVEAARSFFVAQPRGEGFGNGRLARKLYEGTFARLASRLARTGSYSLDDLSVIQAADVGVSVSD